MLDYDYKVIINCNENKIRTRAHALAHTFNCCTKHHAASRIVIRKRKQTQDKKGVIMFYLTNDKSPSHYCCVRNSNRQQSRVSSTQRPKNDLDYYIYQKLT